MKKKVILNDSVDDDEFQLPELPSHEDENSFGSEDTNEESSESVNNIEEENQLNNSEQDEAIDENIDSKQQELNFSPNISQESGNASADLSISKLNQQGNRAIFNTELTVKTCKKNTRIREKHRCPYCGVEQADLPRHLERKHANRSKVKLLLKEKKGSKKRKLLMSKIRRNCNF